MPFSYTPLWNTLNQYNMGKCDLCQTLGISSSTMAKMTNNQKVSMDILARICDYFACGLEDVVFYKSEIELFMEKIKGKIMDGGYTIYAQQFPEYRFQFSDRQMLGIQQMDYVDIEASLRKFELAAVDIHPVHVPIMGTTTFRVLSSRNLVTMQGSLTVIELFMDWLLKKISERRDFMQYCTCENCGVELVIEDNDLEPGNREMEKVLCPECGKIATEVFTSGTPEASVRKNKE